MSKIEIPFKYNKKYYKTIEKDYEKTAENVSKVRWSFVKGIIVIKYCTLLSCPLEAHIKTGLIKFEL